MNYDDRKNVAIINFTHKKADKEKGLTFEILLCFCIFIFSNSISGYVVAQGFENTKYNFSNAKKKHLRLWMESENNWKYCWKTLSNIKRPNCIFSPES